MSPGGGAVGEHDRWDEYWEGTLLRENLNVGTVTTKTLGWMGTYGVTDRLNVIAMAPYVWTKASGGTRSWSRTIGSTGTALSSATRRPISMFS